MNLLYLVLSKRGKKTKEILNKKFKFLHASHYSVNVETFLVLLLSVVLKPLWDLPSISLSSFCENLPPQKQMMPQN
jgi:hypothetical protein